MSGGKAQQLWEYTEIKGILLGHIMEISIGFIGEKITF